jgi:hypothetical protein
MSDYLVGVLDANAPSPPVTIAAGAGRPRSAAPDESSCSHQPFRGLVYKAPDGSVQTATMVRAARSPHSVAQCAAQGMGTFFALHPATADGMRSMVIPAWAQAAQLTADRLTGRVPPQMELAVQAKLPIGRIVCQPPEADALLAQWAQRHAKDSVRASHRERASQAASPPRRRFRLRWSFACMQRRRCVPAGVLAPQRSAPHR